MSDHYVCPCPDGCNGCEVPDFAIKEIERLTADLNESERQTRAQLKRVLQRDERITKLEARVDELEAALRKITSDELYNEAQMSIIADEALANSEVET